jgi:hypothetical protein
MDVPVTFEMLEDGAPYSLAVPVLRYVGPGRYSVVVGVPDDDPPVFAEALRVMADQIDRHYLPRGPLAL